MRSRVQTADWQTAGCRKRTGPRAPCYEPSDEEEGKDYTKSDATEYGRSAWRFEETHVVRSRSEQHVHLLTSSVSHRLSRISSVGGVTSE